MKNKMEDVRNLMIEGMEHLLDEESNFDVEKARALAELGSTLIQSAKVEVDLIKSTGVQGTGFLPEVKYEPNHKQLSNGSNGNEQ